MEAIEFLTHTNYRNLKFQIKSMIQENFRRINEELDERRLKLRRNLEYENLKISEELAMLMRTRVEEVARKRHEWFGIHRMEREIEIDKFLQLKRLQREMENCEEARHNQSKALLLNTKQTQLYQIKEKIFMRQNERNIEDMWVEVTRRFNEEMMKQSQLERKLAKTIASINEKANLRHNEYQKQRIKTSDQAERAEIAKEDARAALVDKIYRTRTKTLEKSKRAQQQKELMEQIENNEKYRKNKEKSELAEDLELNQQNRCVILDSHYKDEKQKIHATVCQEHYISHMRQEAQRKRKESEKFDAIFLGTGCVLQQRNKVPYSKAAR